MAEPLPATLATAALQILLTADPTEKALLGESSAARWLRGEIADVYDPSSPPPPPPRRPSRPSELRTVTPSTMPRLGRGGNERSRLALLHSLAHTESWAIDLSWDIVARFACEPLLPREFFDDFVRVAQEEGRHFTLLKDRLRELGSDYGAFPVHDGLWDSAEKTSGSLLARLAVEHCVHEARGLDVLPTTISRFRAGGDDKTAMLLESVIYPEEITHCAAGVRWFKYLCSRMPDQVLVANSLLQKSAADTEQEQKDDAEPVEHQGEATEDRESVDNDDRHVIQKFHAIVRSYFRGPLKPPFNTGARKAAGFGPAWYEPLAVKEF